MARFRAAPPPPQQIRVEDLPLESQRAYELLDVLQSSADLRGAYVVLRAAGTEPPVGPIGLARVAIAMAGLGYPLTTSGIRKFKDERVLSGGNAITVPVAKAYVRAITGKETLFRLTKKEIQSLKPNEFAALEFLRKFARVKGTEAVRKLKKAMGLGNPKIKGPAGKLKNEYVGVNTVKLLAQHVWKINVALTPMGMKRLIITLDEQAKAAAAAEAAKARALEPDDPKKGPRRPGAGAKKPGGSGKPASRSATRGQ